MRIPVYQPEITSAEIDLVNDCLSSGWISSKGQFVERFEHDFASYIGVPHALTTSNGTTALHLALLALGVGPEDEVIVPTLTYVASANAVTYTGATPVFVDCDPLTWQIDPVDVERVITPRTRAILAVHLYGSPCDLPRLKRLAIDNDLLLIEDCAEALGSFIHDQHVGTFGDIATFSFYGNKTITTGEGGMVTTHDPNLAQRVAHLRGQGLASSREYWHDIVGYNYRMTNISAAIGCAQLTRLSSTLHRKQKVANAYRDRLAEVVTFQQQHPHTTHSHWMVCFLLPTSGDRDQMRDFLAKRSIETRPVFYPLHSMPMYSHLFRRMPNSVKIASRGINVPSYPTLEQHQIDYVCNSVREYLHLSAEKA